MREHPRRLHAKSGRDDRGDLPARRGIDGAVLSRRLSRPARLGTLRTSPFGKKALQMGTLDSGAKRNGLSEADFHVFAKLGENGCC